MLTLALFCLPISLANEIEQPPHPDSPFEPSDSLLSVFQPQSELPDLDISASSNSLMGSECSEKYATTGEYCSGHIRIYHQCLPVSDGLEWQQRSENCGDYPGGGRCVMEGGKAECVDYAGQSSYGLKLLLFGVALTLGGAALGIFVHPVFFILVPIGVWLLIKFFTGGV